MRIKAPKKFGNRSRESPLRGDFTKKLKFLIFWGPHSHLSAPIDVKFYTAKRTHMPVSSAKLDLNRCNESPLLGEKPDFWPVSKNNTGSLPLRGNPAGNKKEGDITLYHMGHLASVAFIYRAGQCHCFHQGEYVIFYVCLSVKNFIYEKLS